MSHLWSATANTHSWDCNGSDAQRFSRNYNVDETLWQAYRHYEYCMQADGLYNGAKVFLRKCPKGITSRTYTTQQIKGTGASYVWDETKYRVGGTSEFVASFYGD